MAHTRPFSVVIPFKNEWVLISTGKDTKQFAPSTHNLSKKEFASFLSFSDIKKQLEMNKKKRIGWKSEVRLMHQDSLESFATITNCPIAVTVGANGDVYKASKIELLDPDTALVRITWPPTHEDPDEEIEIKEVGEGNQKMEEDGPSTSNKKKREISNSTKETSAVRTAPPALDPTVVLEEIKGLNGRFDNVKDDISSLRETVNKLTEAVTLLTAAKKPVTVESAVQTEHSGSLQQGLESNNNKHPQNEQSERTPSTSNNRYQNFPKRTSSMSLSRNQYRPYQNVNTDSSTRRYIPGRMRRPPTPADLGDDNGPSSSAGNDRDRGNRAGTSSQEETRSPNYICID